MNRNVISRAVLAGLLSMLILSIVILSWVPPVSKDALVHHLAVPKLYIRHGGMYEIPTLLFSYYPMNVELLYIIPLLFGNDILPALIHFCFALLTAWLLFDYLRRRLETTSALGGALFFLSIPIIVKLSITAYVDLGLIFFTTASLIFLLRWLDSGLRPRPLLTSAVCCGLAMGTKYNGLIAFLLLALFVPFLVSRSTPAGKPRVWRSLGSGLAFAAVALLLFSPWMVRNGLWTGNPIFPQYDHFFNPHSPQVRQLPDIFTFRGEMYGESWWQVLLLPLRAFFQGRDGDPQYFDGVLNPLLLLLPLLAFLPVAGGDRRHNRDRNILLAFSLLFFTFAFLTGEIRIRYISPVIPPLVILSVLGVRRLAAASAGWLAGWRRRVGQGLVALLVILALGLNLRYILGQYRYVRPFDYLAGRVSRDEYLARYLTEYPVMQWINGHLPAEARVLFFFNGKRGYYCDREYTFDMRDYRGTHSVLMEALRASSGPQDILAALKEKGITHLLINHPLFDEWIQDQCELHEYERMKAFFKNHVELLHYERDYGLSRLKDLEE